MNKENLAKLSGNQIRKSFINFFTQKAGHSFVRSSSLVPGGDATLLFTNSGMVQFKDVFLGTDVRPYTRAVNSQKCLRVAGKHNDLEDVGQNNTHHTFFEMLGNWSFGDYYKKEAIEWAWELLTDVWMIPKEHLYSTVFKDELGEIPTDDEAAYHWRQQPGFDPGHVFYVGRKDNFWEMADTGPCGPCSEIHIDLRPGEGSVSAETLDTNRFIELWNLVFIQYNRINADTLEPLPTVHVDTGMGFERIVNIIQGVGSNYRTDLFWGLIEKTAEISGHSEAEINKHFTPYRVIADHARAAAFLIADGVVPGNMGRNYITRMIIRRAYRFGGKVGLDYPFLAVIAATVINNYGEAYPELVQNRKTILETITREEEQFQKTLDKATNHLVHLIDQLEVNGVNTITGEQAAYLYTTYGMPFEITRDIAKERGCHVDEDGYHASMDAHRMASGAGKALGALGGEDVEVYRSIFDFLQAKGKLGSEGVEYQPYRKPVELFIQTEVLALVKNKKPVNSVEPGDTVEVILPISIFYLESGGQVADTGVISGDGWEINISDMRKPSAGMITHVGNVVQGFPKVGDLSVARVSQQRRKDIMRNHTATHLIHAGLRTVLGNHARQAGSLVAPDRLRFDFNHQEALTQEQIWQIEDFVNQKILSNHPLEISNKPLDEALETGAIALFGEKYEEEVRNIIIGEPPPFSNELCGGTHVRNTSEIGPFIITNESSVAAGIRRIEAITGREAYNHIKFGMQVINQVAESLATTPDKVLEKVKNTLIDLKEIRSQVTELRLRLASVEFAKVLEGTSEVNGIDVLAVELHNTDMDSLRQLADRFRQRYPSQGVTVLASVVNDRPIIVAAVTQDLISRGINAGDLAGFIANQLGGGGGGKPTIAQAGGKYADRLDAALVSVTNWVEDTINS